MPTVRETLRLDAPDGLDPVAILGSLAAHNVPGAEWTDAATFSHSRLVRGPRGPRAVTLQFDRAGIDLEVAIDDSDPSERAAEFREITEIVRRWFDLEADLGPIREALGRDSLLAPLVAARPSLRVIGSPDRFQSAVTTVLGQQVSLAAGRTFAGRLVETFGEPGPNGLRSFPRPATLAAADPEVLRAALGLTGARARTVLALSQAWRDAGHEPDVHELLSIPGVGRWTVDYLSVRFGNRDAFTPGDLVLRRALGGISPREAEARSEAWRPFRAYALVHLWTEAAYASGSSPSRL